MHLPMRMVTPAGLAVELGADVIFATLRCNDPRPIDPWRPMAYRLRVAALEIGEPVAVLIFMKVDYLAFHIFLGARVGTSMSDLSARQGDTLCAILIGCWLGTVWQRKNGGTV